MKSILPFKKKKESENKRSEDGRILTRYDQKMERRRKEEAKAKLEEKIFRIGGIVVAALLGIFLIYSIASPLVKRYVAINKVYATVGDYEFTQQEYDFYTYNVYNEWLESYGSYASMFGLDTSTDLSKQEISDGVTWKDYFEDAAADSLIEYIALTDAAKEAGFEYDTEEDYEAFAESVEEGAEENNMTVSAYYKAVYGQYATAEVVEEQVRFCLYAAEYYSDVVYAGIEVTDDEVAEEYATNSASYDYVDYRSFVVYADYDEDADEDAITAAMEDANSLAEEFLTQLEAGDDFNELCLEYCTEDETESYEDDGSLSEAVRYSSVSSIYSDWLFDESRVENDVEIFEDEDNHCYTIVLFGDRYYDEAIDDEIYSTLFNAKLDTSLSELTENYEITFANQ